MANKNPEKRQLTSTGEEWGYRGMTSKEVSNKKKYGA